MPPTRNTTAKSLSRIIKYTNAVTSFTIKYTTFGIIVVKPSEIVVTSLVIRF